jgi:hypothetical protein
MRIVDLFRDKSGFDILIHMKTWGRRFGYGIALWGILYVAAIPLLGLQTSDPIAFKAVMAGLGSIVGALASGLYMMSIERGYLRESIMTAITWMVSNWVLDVVALLPFTHESVPQYFMHIGVEYLGMFAVLVAIGYVLEKKAGNQ